MNQTVKWISIVLQFFLIFFTIFILFPIRTDNVFIIAVDVYYALIVFFLGLSIYLHWSKK